MYNMDMRLKTMKIYCHFLWNRKYLKKFSSSYLNLLISQWICHDAVVINYKIIKSVYKLTVMSTEILLIANYNGLFYDDMCWIIFYLSWNKIILFY